MKAVIRFLRNEEAATLVEYGLLVGLLAIAAVAGIVAVGKLVNGVFDSVGETFSNNQTGGG